MLDLFDPNSILGFDQHLKEHVSQAKDIFGEINIVSENFVSQPLGNSIKTVGQLVDCINKFWDAKQSDPEKKIANLQNLSEILIKNIIQSQSNWADEENEKKLETIGFFSLVAAIYTFNFLIVLRLKLPELVHSNKALHDKFKGDLPKIEKGFNRHILVIEYISHVTVTNNPFLLALKRAIQQRMYNYHLVYNDDYIFPDKLNRLIQMKNARSLMFDGPYHGMLITNPNSDFYYKPDPVCLEQLFATIDRIRHQSQKRTQILYHCSGHPFGHGLALDVSWNVPDQKIQIICYESATDMHQLFLIYKLVEHFLETNIQFDIIACQSKAQKDDGGCIKFAYFNTIMLSKTSFEEIKGKPSVAPVSLTNNYYGHCAPDVTKLPNVHWRAVSAFGERAVRMCQSLTMIEDLLSNMSLNEGKATEKVEGFKKKYGFNSNSRHYFLNYKEASIHAKLRNTPFEGLTLEGILNRTNTTDLAVAFRRLAAGHGPCREFEFLLDLQSKDASLKLIDSCSDPSKKGSGKTALHNALENAKVKRACLLLQYGAKIDIADANKLTAQDLFKRSQTLQTNAYLQKKLSGK